MITFQRASKAAVKWASFGTLKLRALAGSKAQFHCTACGSDVVGFFRYGENARWGCPACGASPRQRLVAHLLDTGVLAIPAAGSVLHIAPNEAGLVERFKTRATDYVPADLHPDVYDLPGVIALDLMQFDMPERFDVIYASHVMEHVDDDAHVLANMFRALKPGGEAWLIVPLWDRPTEDGHSGMPARERERRFGQWDHVRQYGLDFADRIRQAGFLLDVIYAKQLAAQTQEQHALDDVIFRATKPGH